MESNWQILLIIISQARLTDEERETGGCRREGTRERDFSFNPTTQSIYLGPLHHHFLVSSLKAASQAQ